MSAAEAVVVRNVETTAEPLALAHPSPGPSLATDVPDLDHLETATAVATKTRDVVVIVTTTIGPTVAHAAEEETEEVIAEAARAVMLARARTVITRT